MSLSRSLYIDRKQRSVLVRIAIGSLCACVVTGIAVWAVRAIGNGKSHAAEASSNTRRGAEGLGQDLPALLPIDIEAHEWAADFFLKTDQPRRTIEHLERVRPFKARDRRFNLRLATAYLQASRYADALDILRELSSSRIDDPLSDSVQARLGLALFYSGKVQEGLSLLEETLKKHPGSKEVACYLGEIQASLNPTSAEAERNLQSAIAADRTYTEAWYQLARLYMAGGKYEEARTMLLQVLQLEPLHIRAHSRLGMVYYYLNMPDQALRSYETALILSPDDYNTHYNLGELYYAGGNTVRALSEYKKALAGDPGHVEANFKVGLICMSNGMAKEAIQFLEKARSGAPHNIRVLLQLGVAYEKIDRREDALSIYRSILSFDALNPVALQKIRLLATP